MSRQSSPIRHQWHQESARSASCLVGCEIPDFQIPRFGSSGKISLSTTMPPKRKAAAVIDVQDDNSGARSSKRIKSAAAFKVVTKSPVISAPPKAKAKATKASAVRKPATIREMILDLLSKADKFLGLASIKRILEQEYALEINKTSAARIARTLKDNCRRKITPKGLANLASGIMVALDPQHWSLSKLQKMPRKSWLRNEQPPSCGAKRPGARGRSAKQ